MAFYSDLFRSTTFLTGPVNLAEGATTISGSMGLTPLGRRNIGNPFGATGPFIPSILATNPTSRAVYDSRSISLVVSGEVSGLGTWPVGDLASFAPNPSVIISGSFLIENDGSTFNQLRGLTHIPGNNGLIVGGNLTSTPAVNLGEVISNRDYQNAANIRNNITIFGSGMGEEPSGILARWTSGFNSTAQYIYRGGESSPGAGINMWGHDRTNPGTNDRALRGIRFTMDDQFFDTTDYYGKTFQIQIAQYNSRNSEEASFFSHRKSILQYSFKRGILTLGTVEPIGFGQTTVQASRDITIVSGIQLGGYTPNVTTGPSDSKILLAANSQIRLAGATPVAGQSLTTTEFFLDNVLMFASASSFPVLNRPDYALAIQTGSRASGDPNVYQVGLATLGGGGGGGSALPGGQNYDIQYNQNNNFAGASGRGQFFQYIYDAANTPLLLHKGRFALGELTSATGRYSHAKGLATTATGNYSHAEGSNVTANSPYSHAEGEGTYTTGLAAHAEGKNTNAFADHSHAEGFFTISYGLHSHTEGFNTVTYGTGSHTEGSRTVASGDFSHAEGSSSLASAAYSHAEGFGTLASGIGSHAEGIGTIAAGGNQHAEGTYNISSSTAIWILGDGTSANARHNLIEGHTGQVRVSGSLFVQPGQGYRPSALQSTVLTYNPSTGQIVLMNTSSIGAGGGGGGSTSPGGVNSNIQFNNNGTFGGASRFNYNSSTGAVTISGSLIASGSLHTITGNTTFSGSVVIQPAAVPGTTIRSGNSNPQLVVINTSTGLLQRAQFIETDPIFTSLSASYMPNSLTGSFTTTASFQAFTSSVNSTVASIYNYTQSINNKTGSFVTTSSFQAFTSSIHNFSSSILNFSASMLTYTSSVNTFITNINSYTQSVNNHITSILNFSSSILNFSSSMLSFSASMLNFTSSVNTTIAGLNNYTQSINNRTGSFVLTSSFHTYTSSISTSIASLNNYTQSINNKTGSFATTGSNIFTDKQTLSGSLYIRPLDIPLVSGSQVVTFDPLTGQFNRMLTSSLVSRDGYWIQNGSTLYTSGGFSTVQITGSLYVSSSAGGYGNFNTLQRTGTVRGINTIINSTFISSSNEDAPGLYIWQSNTRARSLQAEGGIGVWFSASSGTQIDHYIQGTTAFTPGIRGVEDPRIALLSGSVELGMVQRRVTETSTGFIALTGSNSIIHAKSTYALAGRTIHFPGSQSVSYGSTFTVVVQNAITGQGIGTTNFACANALVEDPTTNVFQFGYLLENIPKGVYKYVYLNMSGSGNAWVCESARSGI